MDDASVDLEPNGLGMPTGLTQDEQVHLALQLEHAYQEQEVKLESTVLDALEFEFSNPAEIGAYRHSMMCECQAAAEAAKPRTEELLNSAPVQLRPLLSRIHLGFVEWMLDKLASWGVPFRDEHLLRDLLGGFPQVGLLPPSGSSTAEYVKSTPKISTDVLWERHRATNEKVVRSLAESKHSADLWSLCAEDVADGSMTSPVCVPKTV